MDAKIFDTLVSFLNSLIESIETVDSQFLVEIDIHLELSFRACSIRVGLDGIEGD